MREKINELKSDVFHELHNLEKLMVEIKDIKDDGSISIRRVIGSILHDSYNCCERIFRLVVGELNGVVPFGFEWHRQMLNKAVHGVEDVRPPIISEEMASQLEEYLEFRHVFRNIYGFELLGERLIRLKEKHNTVFNDFIKEIKVFFDKLASKK